MTDDDEQDTRSWWWRYALLVTLAPAYLSGGAWVIVHDFEPMPIDLSLVWTDVALLGIALSIGIAIAYVSVGRWTLDAFDGDEQHPAR